MTYDCAIIGSGPAGLNAALVLGRARRKVALIDDGGFRHAVTHGFLTRDDALPAEFRRIAREEVQRYPSVSFPAVNITTIRKLQGGFRIITDEEERIEARKLLIATELKEILPDITGLRELYGKSLFYCPYSDGFELRDQPLIILSEHPNVYHLAKLLYNWSPDLVICTNGRELLTEDQKQALASRNILVSEQTIAAFHGARGMLRQVEFLDGSRIDRSAGFVTPQWLPQAFREELGYVTNESGGILTDGTGKSMVPGLFAAGEAASGAPMLPVEAAASGSMAAVSINLELTEEDFSF